MDREGELISLEHFCLTPDLLNLNAKPPYYEQARNGNACMAKKDDG